MCIHIYKPLFLLGTRTFSRAWCIEKHLYWWMLMYFSPPSLINHLTMSSLTLISYFLIIPRLCLNRLPRTVCRPPTPSWCSGAATQFEVACIGHLLIVSLCLLVLARVSTCPGRSQGWFCPSDLGSGRTLLTAQRWSCWWYWGLGCVSRQICVLALGVTGGSSEFLCSNW